MADPDASAAAPVTGNGLSSGSLRPHLWPGRPNPRPGTGGGSGVAGLDGYPDVVAFVEGTTARIWDDKNPGLVARWYTPTTVVHTSDGDVYGTDQVVASAVRKMAAFPDIRDHVEDTIWAEVDGTYLTSMRWTWTATNTGWSVWGPPTGRRVATRGIAHCVVRDGRYVEEWVAYDELTTLRQLGVAVSDELARLGPLRLDHGFGEVERRVGQDPPAPLAENAYPGPEQAVRSGLHDVWNRRMLGAVDRLYAPSAVVHGPDSRELYGAGDIRHHVLALLAMLPDARHEVDEFYATVTPDGEVRAAARWTLVGTHTGPSRYGPPGGRRVRLLGLSHLRLRHDRVVEEWTVYSELSLLRQIMPVPDPTP